MYICLSVSDFPSLSLRMQYAVPRLLCLLFSFNNVSWQSFGNKIFMHIVERQIPLDP